MFVRQPQARSLFKIFLFSVLAFLPTTSGANPVPVDQSRQTYVYPALPILRMVSVPKSFYFDIDRPETIQAGFEMADDLVSVHPMDFFELMLNDVVSQSSFAGRLNIHGPYSNDHLNIYFFDQDIISEHFGDIQICAYLPPYPLIVCNGENLRSFSSFVSTSEEFYKVQIIERDEETGGSVKDLSHISFSRDDGSLGLIRE